MTISAAATRMEGEANPRRGVLGTQGAQEGPSGRLPPPIMTAGALEMDSIHPKGKANYTVARPHVSRIPRSGKCRYRMPS